MRVLLAATDIFEGIGGGETAYSRIVSAAKKIDFYYFLNDAANLRKRNFSRPQNAHPVVLEARQEVALNMSGEHLGHHLTAAGVADQFARSVAGMSFDLADLADYFSCGPYLRAAFRKHGVSVGGIVLAMHGNLSNSMSLNWERGKYTAEDLEELRALERMQFRLADAVYALSEQYVEDYRREWDRPVTVLDPMCFVSRRFSLCKEQKSKPSLYCVGRAERRKGNDLFLEILRWCGRENYDRAFHIGNPDMLSNGQSSDMLLAEMAEKRGLSVQYIRAVSQEKLKAVWAGKSFLVVPTRYDTLNLVVLEALFSGCPSAVSNRAGVCTYLDRHWPGIPYVKLDFEHFSDSIDCLREAVIHYDETREALFQGLKQSWVRTDLEGEITRFYEQALTRRSGDGEGLDYDIPGSHETKSCPGPKAVREKPRWMEDPDTLEDPILLWELSEAGTLTKLSRSCQALREETREEIIAKLELAYAMAEHRLDRCAAWRQIARLQRKLGFHAEAAAHELRVLRLSEGGKPLLPDVLRSLRGAGYPEQADVAELLYGEQASADRVYAYLQDRRRQWLENPAAGPCAVEYDHRSANARIAVIVSLYNAADKLDFFLSMLSQQTALRKGMAEVILVDSCSPADEYAVAKSYLDRLNCLYLRSSERETIQMAWNRGLSRTGAEYITFLGVDEMLYPEALETLAAWLDSHPEEDWAVGDSLVTAVEKNGMLSADKMLYKRGDGKTRSALLETCYLSYVGGLYRRSLHDRAGYYDGHYRGAGDTEFKNRALPFFRPAYLGDTLGIFLDYPEERVTASPMAEIEDLQAWYLFRTPGGVRYEFENVSHSELEEMLRLSLSYRKSYCAHESADIDYALLLARHLLERVPDHPAASLAAEGLSMLQRDLRRLEDGGGALNRKEAEARIRQLNRNAHLVSARLAEAGLLEFGQRIPIMQDNRYEQHSWVWRPKLEHD